MQKVKIITNNDPECFARLVTYFIQDYNIVDIHYSTTGNGSIQYSAMIIYEE